MNLSALTPVELQVIDLGNLENIADSLPSVSITGVDTSASQIIVIVNGPAGTPLPGVSVAGNPAGGAVVYDAGDGVYDDGAAATGSGGTIILFNAGLDGDATLTLSYTSPATMMPATKSLTVKGAAGAATIGAIQLD